MSRPSRKRRGGAGKFVKLDEWFLKTCAWTSLDTVSRCAYIELARLYNGKNNGELAMSCRRLGELLHVSKDTADRALRRLVNHGFIRIQEEAGFGWKAGSRQRLSASYALTQFAVGNALPTKEFIHWSPDVGPPEIEVPAVGGKVVTLHRGKAA